MKVAVCTCCGAMLEYQPNGKYHHDCPNPMKFSGPPNLPHVINAFKVVNLLTREDLAAIFKSMTTSKRDQVEP